MSTQFFRANVGIVVARPDGRVLVLERAEKPGSWQMPQGGLEEGEEPREASIRELREETGLTERHAKLVAEFPDWLAYELPPEDRKAKHGRGQVQKWFLYRFTGEDADIRSDRPPGEEREFKDFKWVELERLAEEVWEVRRPIYRALAAGFAGRLAE